LLFVEANRGCNLQLQWVAGCIVAKDFSNQHSPA
jgi:hypothetical protein